MRAGSAGEEIVRSVTDPQTPVSKAEYDAFAGFAFETMDKDGSGELSPDEVDDFVVGDAFKMLDDDGNGSVSMSEFTAEMDGDFASADEDGDGALD